MCLKVDVKCPVGCHLRFIPVSEEEEEEKTVTVSRKVNYALPKTTGIINLENLIKAPEELKNFKCLYSNNTC